MEEHGKAPAKRVAQHKLAEEVLKIVHGKLVAAEAKQEHSKIFQSSSHPQRNIRDTEAPIEDSGQKPPDMNRSVNRDGPVITAANAPTYSVTLPRSLVYKQPISRLLYHAGLVASRSEGHRLVAKKGAYLGAQSGGTSTMGDQVSWKTAENWDGEETEKYIIGDDRLMLRAGKWKVKVVKIIGDEEFEQRGLEAPGWKELKLQESSEG